VDRLKPPEIAGQIAEAAALGDFHSLHPVSARTGDGIAPLRDELVGILPEGPAYFPEGETTDLPLEVRVAELVREKALALTREEVPHAISVEVEEIEDGLIRANLYVETHSQKAIVVGKSGRVIKAIGTEARPEIERLLGGRVFLDLHVKLRPKWRRDEALLERLGI
ncbi:MAG TPA: KH domain-containing protein, partial [Gaiellaceae bacterium]|nr:KH domain-containing protein [Gaiellaceae bacterium]